MHNVGRYIHATILLSFTCFSSNHPWLTFVGIQARNGLAIPVNACPNSVIQYQTLGGTLFSSVIRPGKVDTQQNKEPMKVKMAPVYRPKRRPYLDTTNGATILKGTPRP